MSNTRRAKPRPPLRKDGTEHTNIGDAIADARKAALPGIEVPSRVVDALVGYGLRTQEGQTLMNVWREEQASLKGKNGTAQLIVGPGRLVLQPTEPHA